ncbi:MAG: formate acetyltransferase [Desulfobacca sp.]|nr:formate acetyltransferase [Desulfobacca sp.]
MPLPRIERLKKAVQSASPGVCPERALLWTRYFRDRENRKKTPAIQMAEALREVLLQKTIRIYPDELVVGSFSSKRVGGSIYPELHGLVVMQDLFKFSTRKNSPLQISKKEIHQLIQIIPFWLFRFLGIKAHPSKIRTIRFIADQLQARTYFINETGGVAHIAPDYEKLISWGTDGIISQVQKIQEDVPKGSDSWAFYQAVMIIASGLAEFGERYSQWALEAAKTEQDPVRQQELLEIAAICHRVPRLPATTFQEALQSIFFAQIAINLESLDNGNSPGRMDFYLYPFYEKDLEQGILTREKAKELISAFSIKMSEIIPVFSRPITRFHGGMFNGQVVTVGGTDRDGNDSSNDLSIIFLEVMDELRMRQPNYHARMHPNASKEYLDKVFGVLTNGGNSPALYNDEVIVETMVKNGYSPEDARNYTAVGCVEPVSQGKSLSSTDAALFNLPAMLELALNEGKRFGSLIRTGQKTRPIAEMQSLEDVKLAFESQLDHGIERLLQDLQAVERANTLYHPTPFTSMLLDGCLQTGLCSTAGGARYNFSGIQCVGPADTGDSLYAIEKAVFSEKKFTLPELVDQLKKNLPDPGRAAYLRGLAKFGNDQEEVDQYTRYAVETFNGLLTGRKNTRGGTYTTGLYSVTAHLYFGQVTGALPNGRKKGESFASGLSPSNGQDRKGPTALLNSVNRLDAGQCANGINLNITFGLETIKGKIGRQALQSLFRTYFRRGGMQVQLNVIDPSVLIAARDNPQAYPFLLIRVSGYSAYFNDLLPAMKDEIIQRTCFRL